MSQCGILDWHRSQKLFQEAGVQVKNSEISS